MSNWDFAHGRETLIVNNQDFPYTTHAIQTSLSSPSLSALIDQSSNYENFEYGDWVEVDEFDISSFTESVATCTLAEDFTWQMAPSGAGNRFGAFTNDIAIFAEDTVGSSVQIFNLQPLMFSSGGNTNNGEPDSVTIKRTWLAGNYSMKRRASIGSLPFVKLRLRIQYKANKADWGSPQKIIGTGTGSGATVTLNKIFSVA